MLRGRKHLATAVAATIGTAAPAYASPLHWGHLPHWQVRAGVIVTATTSGLVAYFALADALRKPSESRGWQALRLALAIVIALISATGFWLLATG